MDNNILIAIVLGATLLVWATKLATYGTAIHSVREKMLLIYWELKHLCLVAGEANPFYHWITVYLMRLRPELIVEILLAPTLWLEPAVYKRVVNPSTGRLKSKEMYRDFSIHPLIQHWHDTGCGKTLKIYVKRRGVGPILFRFFERHFGYGLSTKKVYIEKYHGRNPGGPGWLYHNDSHIFEKKRKLFNKLKQNSSVCELLTEKNYERLMSQVKFEPAEGELDTYLDIALRQGIISSKEDIHQLRPNDIAA